MTLCDWRVDSVEGDQVHCTALVVCGKKYDMFKKPRHATFSKDDRCITTWLPTPEEIKSATEKIRSEWDDERQTTRPTHQDVEISGKERRFLVRVLANAIKWREQQAHEKRLAARKHLHRGEVRQAHRTVDPVQKHGSTG